MALSSQCALASIFFALLATAASAQQLSASSFSLVAQGYSSSSFTPDHDANPPVAPAVTGGWLLRRFSIGSYTSPLGFGGRFAVSITHSVNLRAGASYFSLSTTQTADDIPFTVNIRFQSEQVGADWYPFHNNFHVSPGILFGSTNRVFGSTTIPSGEQFTLNNVNYYSSAANPVQASGSVVFSRTAPTLTVGWGNWIRHENMGHWTFPFEMGVAFERDPKTTLNFAGEVCFNSATLNCENIADSPDVQANIAVAHKKLQDDADWLRFYPIIAGGIVYRF
jgi:hypothetical protein